MSCYAPRGWCYIGNSLSSKPRNFDLFVQLEGGFNHTRKEQSRGIRDCSEMYSCMPLLKQNRCGGVALREIVR